MTVRKVGIEEELLLIDPDTRRLRPVSEGAVSANDEDIEVEHELYLPQIETATPPCVSAEELEKHLRAGRRAVGEAAAAAGARAVAVATPPLDGDQREVTPKTRYRKILSTYGELARQAPVCAMHVHVEVEDPQDRVKVIDRLRPWLPMLLAISSNSPYSGGRDTDHASWRSQVWGRWPVSGPVVPFGDLETYRAVSRQLIEWGGALDAAMLYFDVRLAEQYPTVEVRVADVCTDTDDAILLALLARALVETCATHPDEPAQWRLDTLRVADWRAARYGLAADLVHPTRFELAPPRAVFDSLLEYVTPALEEAGDHDRVVSLWEQVSSRGSGATRQRRVFERTGEVRAVVDDLAERTEESWR